MFLCDEVVQESGFWFSTRAQMQKLDENDSRLYSIQILWQYRLSNSKLCGSKHMYKPAHLNYVLYYLWGIH